MSRRHARTPGAACLVVPLLALALAGCAATAPVRAPLPADADLAIAAPTVARQARRAWSFPGDGVTFDNRLPAARLNDVTRLGPDRYRLRIEPEIRRINPSPWYGFRVTATKPRNLSLEFEYPGSYRHRYTPKLSGDGREWRTASAEQFDIGEDGIARLRIEAGPQSLQVFAQPPLVPGDVAAWTGRVAGRVDITRHVFGESVAGRPLELFSFGKPGAPLVVVLGRQHPPENTGHLALMDFVDTLAADTPLARAFRARHQVLVTPLLNPDGVLEGHWRTNLAGTDLNRDWGPFAQPETRALRDVLLARGERDGIVFAIDFHSTFSDVFYTVAEDPSRQPGGVLHGWMQDMRTRFPGRIEEKAYAATSTVFKNWAYCRFGTPAVTYEVGDATTDEVLGEVSAHAATSLMRRLLAGPAVRPAPADCPPTAP